MKNTNSGSRDHVDQAAERGAGRVRIVLVVEDDPPVAELVTGAIGGEPGYVAVSVPTAADAMRTMSTITPNAMVIDVSLPGTSGIDLYDRMQEDDRLKNVPVMFETAAGPEHAAALRERGVAAYVSKPFDLDAVVELVRRLAPRGDRATDGATATA